MRILQLVRMVFLPRVHIFCHLIMASLPWITAFPLQTVVCLTTLKFHFHFQKCLLRTNLKHQETPTIVSLSDHPYFIHVHKSTDTCMSTVVRQNYQFLLYFIQCIGNCNGSQYCEDPASRAVDDEKRVPPPEDKPEAPRDTNNCELKDTWSCILYT